MSAITWRETEDAKIIEQWGSILRKPPLFSWSRLTDKEIEEMQPDIERIRQIALDIFQMEAIERAYAERIFTEPAYVVFPGNVVRECSLTDVEHYKDYVIPTPDGEKMVLVGRSFFNLFAPRSIMGIEGDYSCKWECVMDSREFSPYYGIAWAMKDIDYEGLGFRHITTRGFLCDYQTYAAPHHLKYYNSTYLDELFYCGKMQQYQQWDNVP